MYFKSLILDSGRSKFAGIQAFHRPAPWRYPRLLLECKTSDWQVGMTPGSNGSAFRNPLRSPSCDVQMVSK